jgi:toluene monooxygenase system protein D
MSTSEREAAADTVGPVLARGPLTDAVVAAIRALNPQVEIRERGAYLRVLAPRRCRVTREEIERQAMREFRFPRDLEALMPSFKGAMHMSEEEAVWETSPGGAP